MRQALEDVSDETESSIKFRQEIFKILRHFPKVQWIVFEDPYEITVDMEYLESRGINPEEFLVISEKPFVGESYYNRVHYDSHIPRQYYGNVFDLTLEAVTYNRITFRFQYDIPREIEKLGGSKYLSDPLLRKLAIESIYRRELRL
jgi:hypothetical protein